MCVRVCERQALVVVATRGGSLLRETEHLKMKPLEPLARNDQKMAKIKTEKTVRIVILLNIGLPSVIG